MYICFPDIAPIFKKFDSAVVNCLRVLKSLNLAFKKYYDDVEFVKTQFPRIQRRESVGGGIETMEYGGLRLFCNFLEVFHDVYSLQLP